MALKSILSKTSKWLRSCKLSRLRYYQPELDDQGLISPQADSAGSQQADSQQTVEPLSETVESVGSRVLVKSVQAADKQESLEKLQQGFNQLVEQLRGINDNLNRQVTQQEDLLARMEKLPMLLESFPAAVESQKHLTEQALEQLKTIVVSQRQFIETVEKIPTETAKQTDALIEIDHQLAAAADADVQMAESFNRFNATLNKLNQSNAEQTDSIIQMNKTFATSDRYFKYIISRQNKRFMLIFAASITVCVLVVLVLVGIVIYLKQ